MELDLATAIGVAEAIIRSIDVGPADHVVLVGDPFEFPGGWIFFYNSSSYLATANASFALAGNAPIAVFRSGDVRILGTAHPVEYYLHQLPASVPPFGEA